MKKCIVCGRESFAKICSEECVNKIEKKEAPEPIVKQDNCIYCGKEVPNTGRHIYTCGSKECQNKLTKDNQQNWYNKRTNVRLCICGVRLEKGQHICLDCKNYRYKQRIKQTNIIAKKRRIKKPILSKICAYCSEEFFTPNLRQTCCLSVQCRKLRDAKIYHQVYLNKKHRKSLLRDKYAVNSYPQARIIKLVRELGFEVEIEKEFPWLVGKKNLRLDVFIPEKNIAIEYQGEQHYDPNHRMWKRSKWFKYEDQVNNDEIKRKELPIHGITLLELNKYSNMESEVKKALGV